MAKKKDQIIDGLLLDAYWRKRQALPHEADEQCPVCGGGALLWKHSLSRRDNGTGLLASIIWCPQCFVGVQKYHTFDDADDAPTGLPLTETFLEGFPHQSKLRTLGGQARRAWRPRK
ncbi:MAG: hypothetical protein JWM90_189 [Thermoleophilia bacterium]|nr:hypothetical protein [Thermoleophilia bacterium]